MIPLLRFHAEIGGALFPASLGRWAGPYLFYQHSATAYCQCQYPLVITVKCLAHVGSKSVFRFAHGKLQKVPNLNNANRVLNS